MGLNPIKAPAPCVRPEIEPCPQAAHPHIYHIHYYTMYKVEPTSQDKWD
jgi:hypothetical protein